MKRRKGETRQRGVFNIMSLMNAFRDKASGLLLIFECQLIIID